MPLEALKYFDSPLDVFSAPVLFPDLAEKKKKKNNSLGHAQATVTEHAKEYARQISARSKPVFGHRLSQGISPGPDQPCFHEPISKPYVKNSYWQEL